MSEHISPAMLAELVDNRLHGSPDAVMRHLATCDRCAALYAELVDRRARWLGASSDLAGDADLIEAGLTVPESVARERGRPRRTTTRRSLVLRTAGVIALAAVVTAGAWLWHERRAAYPEFVREIAHEVDLRMAGELAGVAYSAQVEAAPTTYRNGSPSGEDLLGSLARLADYYNNERMTSDVAYWLIGGYLVAGQLRHAETYLDEAMQLFLDAERLSVLAGILAYKQSDLSRAEQHFREALDADPEDGVACYNLGVVMMEQGRAQEAASVLNRAEKLLRGTALHERVMSALEQEGPG